MLFTQYIAFIFAAAALALIIWWTRKFLRERRRELLYATPLHSKWVELLNSNVPLSNKIPKHLLSRYHGHINFFLHDKDFVGRGGLEIDDQIRLTVAGNACLMVLNHDRFIFPGFKTIIVYPDTYQTTTTNHNGGVVSHSMQHRAGESWHRGPVVLSWSDIQRGANNPEDAHNVVIHEFAHKLDEENQIMDGLPILKNQSHYKEWADVLSEEYESFLERVDRSRNDIIDSYGAVSAIEFFAVISESFFEKSKQMKRKLPALYEQLSRYYGLDTADW